MAAMKHYVYSPISRGPAACACGFTGTLADVRQHVGSNGMWPPPEKPPEKAS